METKKGESQMNDNYPRNDIHADIITFIHIIVLTEVLAFAASTVIWSFDVLVFGTGLSFWAVLQVCAFIALVVAVLSLGQIKHQNRGTRKR